MHWVNSGSVPSRRHYFLLSQPDWLMATYGVRAIRVAERGFNPQDRGWAARISLAKNTDDEATRIAVALAKWSIDSNGLIWNGQRYVQMLDGLVAGLDGRYISGPVDEEDHRFIKRA